jgi:hypothetical protein
VGDRLGILAPVIAGLLDDLEVRPGGTSATVLGEPVTADTPVLLSRGLAALLYQLVHAGRDEPERDRPRTLREAALDRALGEAMPHTDATVRAVVEKRLDDGTLLASLDGLRVLLPAGALLGPVPDVLPAPVAVRVAAARPALSPGFFLADGSAGSAGSAPHVLRLYLHLAEVAAAPAAWGMVLSRLEELGLPYRAKVTSATRLFPRRDALVIYLGPSAWHAVPAVAELVGDLPGLGRSTSPFAREIVPGLAAAWEPRDGRPWMRGVSFGEHRCAALAEGLVAHAVRADETDRRVAVAEAFFDAGIDPLAPARNLASPPFPEARA